jgi:transcriptional regulator with XRE-family HTH domain
MEFSERLKAVAKARGVSMAKLAKDSGISRSALSNFTAGTRRPSYKVMVKLRNALGCSWDELLG